ncbi:hypothetical protein D3C84_434920 [compost metagenome]
MRAHRHQFSFVHHCNTIGVFYRGQAMGDDQGGAVFHQAWQGLLDQVFALGIEGAGGFIEQQNGRIDQQRPCDGESLALAAGQTEPAITQVGLITVGHGLDKVVGIGNVCRGLNLGQGRRRVAVADVLFDAAEKQRRGLRDQSETTTQVQWIKLCQGHAIEQNTPVSRVVKTQQQVIHRRFSGAGRPDQSKGFTGVDRQTQTIDGIAFRS